MMQSKQAYTRLAVEKLDFAQKARNPETATMYYSATAAYAAMAAIAPDKTEVFTAGTIEQFNGLYQMGHDPKEEED